MVFSRKYRFYAVVLATLVVPGCAPQSQVLQHIKPGEAYMAERSFASSRAAWPAEDWWSYYGDAQLDTLMETALSGTPDLAVAEARLQKAQAQVIQAQGQLMPTASANGNYSYQKSSYYNGFPPDTAVHGWNNSLRGTLDFSYELDFWGKNKAKLASAVSQLEASETELAQARLTLTTSLASDYAELARQMRELDELRSAVETRAATARLTRERFSSGIENASSVHQAESLLADAQTQVTAAEGNIGISRNKIAALLGQGPDAGLDIARPKFISAMTFGLPENLPLEIVGRRPDVRASRLMVEAAAEDVKASRADFYPNINLTAYIGRQALGLEFIKEAGSNIGSVGPAISLPVFNRSSLKSALRSAEANYNESVANYDSDLTHALQDVADAVVTRRSLEGQISTSKKAVKEGQAAYDLNLKRYKAGLTNYLTVVDSESSLIGLRRTLANVQARVFLADVDLVRALGGGYAATVNGSRPSAKRSVQ